MAKGLYFECTSQLTGEPIVVVFTWDSRNVKTGNMIQTWIMLRDVPPHVAARTGQDIAICGDCKGRHCLGGHCYVFIENAPLTVWKAYHAGAYRPLTAERLYWFVGELLRIGSYGDPTAVPVLLWKALLRSGIAGWTGYTHQWNKPGAQDCQGFLQASVDSPAEWAEAAALGWGCFRVRKAEESVLPGEFVCPASPEGGEKTTCAKCTRCRGACGGSSPYHRVIVAHGPRAARAAKA